MKRVRWFLDTEFIDRGDESRLDLISIGLVSDDGRTYYAISGEFDPARADPSVQAHVIAKLDSRGAFRRKSRQEIASDIRRLVLPGGEKPEFWAYFASYDWVIFCQLFGSMMKMPKGMPHLCFDIAQRMEDLGISRNHPFMPKLDESLAHHALVDAEHDLAMFHAIDSIVAAAAARGA